MCNEKGQENCVIKKYPEKEILKFYFENLFVINLI